MSLFDDDLFGTDHGQPPAPQPCLYDEGVIPGWSVRVNGHSIAMGMTERGAIAVALKHNGEIWGYGKTANQNFPARPFESARLAYVQDGNLIKTSEYP